MAREGEQQAMTAERLAEIRQGIEVGQMDMDEDEAFWAIRDLLAEVERLRAREAALLAALPFLRELAKARISMLDDDDVIIKVSPGRAAWVISRCQMFMRQIDEKASGGDGA